MHGFINLIKEKGISSNAALQKAKKQLNIKKAGHLGTLDPMAEGVLVLGINRGTKFSSYFLESDKVYRAEITLGIATDTDDAMGQVILENTSSWTKDAAMNALNSFKGKSMQVAPHYSALKHKGKPLYKYAREGTPILKPPREVNIFSIENVSFKDNVCICDIHCSKGTYIRAIARDLGQKLDVGGHLSGLKRLEQGIFNINDAQNIEDLTLDSIIPIEEGFPKLDRITLNPEQTKFFLNGVKFPYKEKQNSLYKIFSNDKIFLGLGEIDESNLKLTRLV